MSSSLQNLVVKPGLANIGSVLLVASLMSCGPGGAHRTDAQEGLLLVQSLAEPPQPHEASVIVPMIQNRRVLSYPLEQVWPTALRYLRVDRGYELRDRDEDSGYIIFEFPLGESRLGRGSVEMFRTEDASHRPAVQLLVQTNAGPSYLPHAIGEGIAGKLLAERGQPPTTPSPPPEEKPLDKPKPDGLPPVDGGPPPRALPPIQPN